MQQTHQHLRLRRTSAAPRLAGAAAYPAGRV